MKALMPFRAGPAFVSMLTRMAPEWLDVVVVDPDDRAAYHRDLPDTDVLLHILDPVTAEIIRRAPDLALIQKFGVGVNTIDRAAAAANGVAVCNMPGSNTTAVVEFTLALMLAAMRRLVDYDAATRRGAGWHLDPAFSDGIGEIAGRTVGLVGYGAVGRQLDTVLTAMGARVLHTSTGPKGGDAESWRTLPDLLDASEILSLHLPLTPDTQHLIDAAALARLPDGAVLVNTSRGGIVDEAALVTALRNGKIAAAGLDVFTDEPLPADDRIATAPNVVLAPHVAWLTGPSLDRHCRVAIENCRRLHDGVPLLHEVLPED
jgi:phosphoglycerate dehydrogenase-like enzyme